MTEERQEKNHCLAEWAGFKLTVYDDHEMLDHQWHHPDCRCEAVRADDKCSCIGCFDWADEGNPPDFYTSEDASALLLEKLLRGGLTYSISWDSRGYAFAEYGQFMSCHPKCPERYPTRQTAIAEAAIVAAAQEKK